MGKQASQENVNKVKKLIKQRPEELGPKLGFIIYKANLPGRGVIAHLDISPPVYYRWIFCTAPIPKNKIGEVQKLIGKLAKAKHKGMLPATGNYQQRQELLENIINEL